MFEEKSIKKNNKNFFLLVGGMMTSTIGNIIFDYVNSMWIITLKKNSSLIMAIYQSSQVIVNLILNILGGVIADRYSKKRILIITDFIFAITSFICAMFSGNIYAIYFIIVANMILAAVNSFNSPCYRAIVKEAIVDNKIQQFNSCISAMSEIIRIIGPILGLLSFNNLGNKGSFILIGCIFLLSVFLEVSLSIKSNNVYMPEKNKGIKRKFHNLYKDTISGIYYISKRNDILTILIIVAFVNFFLSGYNFLIPYTNNIYSGIVQNIFSKLMIAEAIGGIIAALINSKIKMDKSKNLLLISLGLAGVSVLLFPVIGKYTNNWIILMIPIALFGLFITMFNITFATYIQLNTEEEYLGRVFSIIFTAAGLLMPIGSFISQKIIKTDSLSGFVYIGLGIILIPCMYYILKLFKVRLEK